ncbi:hypothetical protein KCU78_g2989, partial [Aureobasidium melanogenum]
MNIARSLFIWLLSSNPFAQQLYPDPRDQQGYYYRPAQRAYPAHQPVFTLPYTPTFDAAAPFQQDAPASTKAASNSVPRKRKRRDEQEHKDDQLIQPPEKKSRNEQGIERKKQKADDKKYRNDLKQERDEVVSRLSEMGHKMVPNGAEQAEFDQLITSLTDLDRQIDRTTEEDIDYYSMRPERGPRNRPAKKRFGDWKEGTGGGAIPSNVSHTIMNYVSSIELEDLDQSKHALDISEIVIDPDLLRSKKKGKSKQKTKAEEMESISGAIGQRSVEVQAKNTKTLTFSAGEFFKFLFHAVEDGQDITYLEKKYLNAPIKRPEKMIVIEEEDYELMKEWSVKYEVPAIVRRVHEIVGAQTRKTINKKYHERLVEWIFENLSAIRDDIRKDLEGSERLEGYDNFFSMLSTVILELASCDLALETGDVVPKETGDAQKEYGLEVD